MRHVFARHLRRFDRLFQKRAYVHWYLADGMEESEISLARESVQDLIKEYEEVIKCDEGNSEEEGME